MKEEVKFAIVIRLTRSTELRFISNEVRGNFQ